MRAPTGKYTRIDANSPRALAICDYSGVTCMHSDLIKQMEYRGNGLVWTGFWVHKKFADKPNSQMLMPIVMADPFPVQNPRPDTSIDPEPLPISGLYPQNPAPPTGANYPPKGIYKKSDFF